MRLIAFATAFTLSTVSFAAPPEVAFEIGTLDAHRGPVITASLTPTMQGMPVVEQRIVRDGGTFKLQRRATDGKSCLTVSVDLLRDGITLWVPPVLQGESCSGENCEHCKFREDGAGCRCARAGNDDGAAYCNHNPSRDAEGGSDTGDIESFLFGSGNVPW